MSRATYLPRLSGAILARKCSKILVRTKFERFGFKQNKHNFGMNKIMVILVRT
jgi:hypothetical protein